MFVFDGRLPDEEQTLTIRPQPRSAITGAAARISRIGAITWSLPLLLPVLVGQLIEGRTALVPALLTSASSRPKRSEAVRDETLAGIGVRDVERECLGAARIRGADRRGGAAVGRGRRQRLLAAPNQHDGRPFAGKRDRGRLPDPAGGSGDDAQTVVEAEVHRAAFSHAPSRGPGSRVGRAAPARRYRPAQGPDACRRVRPALAFSAGCRGERTLKASDADREHIAESPAQGRGRRAAADRGARTPADGGVLGADVRRARGACGRSAARARAARAQSRPLPIPWPAAALVVLIAMPVVLAVVISIVFAARERVRDVGGRRRRRLWVFGHRLPVFQGATAARSWRHAHAHRWRA